MSLTFDRCVAICASVVFVRVLLCRVRVFWSMKTVGVAIFIISVGETEEGGGLCS